MILPAETITAPGVAAGTRPNNCGGWNSTTRPPDYIRVLRRKSGRVERVPFKRYVVTVLGKEWPAYLPFPVVQAGAVAVKQYAWFHAMGKGRQTRKGQCFDVRDGTGDQLYKPNKARVRQDHYDAVNSTWGVRLLKHGQLFMTGYRRGNKARCGHDATGWKLYARSATRCAHRGFGYQQILRTYYGPGLDIVGSGSGQQSSSSSLTASDASSTADLSAQVLEATTPEASILSATPHGPTPAALSIARPTTLASAESRVFYDLSQSLDGQRGSSQLAGPASANGYVQPYPALTGGLASYQFVGLAFVLIRRRRRGPVWADPFSSNSAGRQLVGLNGINVQP